MSAEKPLRDRFWETVPIDEMTTQEWEALCDGCGRCCLAKLEFSDNGEVAYTNVACRLLDDDTARCSQYEIRKTLVPNCVVLTPETIAGHAYWLPSTCAYKRLYEGDQIPGWHPLITGDPETTHTIGNSARGRTVPEYEVDEEDLENYLAPGLK